MKCKSAEAVFNTIIYRIYLIISFAVLGVLSDGDVWYEIISELLQGDRRCLFRTVVSIFSWKFH